MKIIVLVLFCITFLNQKMIKRKTNHISITTKLYFISALMSIWFTPLQAQTTFNNLATITIPASGTGNANPASPATPYPSNITVSGMSGSITKLTLTLHNLSHTATNDIDMLLVGPTGAKIIFLSDIGGGSGALNITFDDMAASQASNPLSSGTFRPTDLSTTGILDNFPAPSPGAVAADEAAPGVGNAGTATFTNKFVGTAPNGTWSLYVVDDVGGDIGSVAGGWSLTITAGVPDAPTTTSIISSLNPSFTTAPNNSVTFTSTTVVSSSGTPVTTGTMTFLDGATTIAGPIALNGSGQASFTTSSLIEGTHNIIASYSGASGFVASTGSITQVVNNHTTVNGNMYCNTGSIAIPISGTQGVAQPYPSNIFVSGVGGTISKVTVQLNLLNQTSPDDIDILLVGPGGQNVILMSDAGGAVAESNINLSFDDAAASFLPDVGGFASGTYKPSNYGSGDTWSAPAPVASGGVLLSTYNGLSPNGTWSLYVFDDAGGDIGSIAGGWCLTITSGAVPTTSTVLTSTPNPSFTTAPNNVVTFTATVTSSGNPVPSGTVTFSEGFVTLGGPTAVNGSGQATFVTSSLAEGTHLITATYNGNVNFAQSTGTVSQEVNTRTVVTGGNMFCNPGSITIPVSGTTQGPSMPYPSNIFVTGLSGNVANLTVKLNGLGQTIPDDIDILLVSPGGQNIILMSDAGGTTPVSNLNFTFDDAAASSLPDGPTLVSGTFKPSNYNSGTDTWTAPAPVPSGSTLLSTFIGFSANGTWKLYVFDDSGGDIGSINGGWCIIIGTLPGVTLQPNNQTICNGNNVTFTSTADGFPAPTVQWQVSTNSGMSWSNIAGATSTTLSFAVTAADNGKQYRAVFANSNGSTNSNAAILTVPTPNASFAYGESGYCQLGSDPTPVIYGTPGGTFSGPGTVSINSGTGKIDVSASTAGGPYTITYNTGGTCPASSTFQVSIVNCMPGASMTDAIIIDNGTPGSAEPNDRIRLTTTITNAQAANYESVQMMLNNDTRVTFVPGSFKSTPVAVNDAYTTTINTLLSVVAANGLLLNDFDDNIPGLTVTGFSPVSVQGGTVSVSANGSFTYNPLNGFTGNDTFTYTITDSDMQTNVGTVKIHVQ